MTIPREGLRLFHRPPNFGSDARINHSSAPDSPIVTSLERLMPGRRRWAGIDCEALGQSEFLSGWEW